MRTYVKMMKEGLADKGNDIQEKIMKDFNDMIEDKDTFERFKKWYKKWYDLENDTSKEELCKYIQDDIQNETKDELCRRWITHKMIDDAGWRIPKDYEIKEWLDLIKDPANYKIEGFEGAVVLDPKPGIYLNDPVAVLDYASLYPSSIIEKNLSHETQVEDDGLIDHIGKENLHEISYENFVYVGKGKGDTVQKIVNEKEPIKTCYFLRTEFMEEKGIGSKGIIPQVLDHLLATFLLLQLL